MFKNYLITFTRAFLRQPIYSSINVFGLVFGLACSIFAFLWVLDELTYDRYHPDNDRVYKLMANTRFSDGSVATEQWTNGLLAEMIKSEVPEIEQSARYTWSEMKLLRFGDKSGYHYGYYADPAVFETLNLTIKTGYGLPDNHSIAITEKLAQTYFGNDNPLGKVIRLDNQQDVTVTAILKNPPWNSNIDYEVILPFQHYITSEFGEGHTYDGDGYVINAFKLRQGASVDEATSKAARIAQRLVEEGDNSWLPPFLFPLHDWRLYNSFENGSPSGNGRITYVMSFAFIGAFILLIACINFMNLSTARSVNRSREVGIRKVAGASRPLLVWQFLAESVGLSFFSLLGALLIVHLLLPVFNGMTEKRVVIDYLDPLISGSLIGITLLTGLLAGSYPAFFLSSFRPASVLKGNLQATYGGARIRRGLVVFQFGLSMMMIVCALVVYDQIHYMRRKNLGFDRENVISINTNELIQRNFQSFRNELLQGPVVESVTLAAAHPMEINGWATFEWEGKTPGDDTYFNIANCDYDYLSTFRFQLLEGRNFSPEYPSDSLSILVTQSAAKHMGFAHPVGQRISEDGLERVIIGVINDFNNLSITDPMHPTVLTFANSPEELGRWAQVFIRYRPGSVTEALEYVQAVYKKNFPDYPIQYGFADQTFEQQFKSESMVARLAGVFTAITMVISVLGLFGLAAFSAERRGKEISIRKVLGATVSGLVILLCRDFTRLIVFGIILGSPIAYYLMQQFLLAYPYRTEMNVYTFVIPGITMLIAALCIVSWQSIRASMVNPAVKLKNE